MDRAVIQIFFGDKEKRNRGQNRYEYLPNEKTKMKVNMSQIILKY